MGSVKCKEGKKENMKDEEGKTWDSECFMASKLQESVVQEQEEEEYM